MMLAGVLVLVALAYWSGLHGGFVFDDFPNIVDNPTLHVTLQSTASQWLAAMFSSPASDLQRPLAMLSFAINHALTGLDPFWMKLTNLGIHLVNTCLVYGLVRRLLQAFDSQQPQHLRREWIALWIAAAWALNPINLMAVLFVVQRMESLCHMFVFAGLWLYLDGRSRLLANGRGWPRMLGGLIGGTALGALAKESAVLLPLYALALEWALSGFSGPRHLGHRRVASVFGVLLALPAVTGLAWLLPKVLAQNAYSSRDFSLAERLLTESRVVVDYLHWTLLPNLGRLSLYHDDYPISRGLLDPPSTLAAIALIALLIGALSWLRSRRPLAALGLAWFLSAQLLTATIIPLELVYEHRNYFASLGLCLVMADILLCLPRRDLARKVGKLAAAGLLLLYAGETSLRAREWSDPVRFSMTEAAKHPQSPRAAYDLGRNLVILTRYRPDSPFVAPAFAALDRATRVPNANTLPETALIFLAARLGAPQRPEWWQGLQRKLRSQPIGPQQTSSLASLVDCVLKDGCRLAQRDMIDTFLAALERGPNAEVLNIYGNYALNVLHDPGLALRLWQGAVEQAPNVVQYRETLARLLIAEGQLDAARAQIAQVRQLGRMGQNEAVARELDRLAGMMRQRAMQPEPAGAPLKQGKDTGTPGEARLPP
ncbi:hypothetical protein [Cognatiluteimonas profundi]|uniref:hypothetical protein n=1 Tax=Cognatiluteimonas profundi TaxID=2594501 RepID=UPI00131A7687|nr:hypothetical protein [Lysobacter profundi]